MIRRAGLALAPAAAMPPGAAPARQVAEADTRDPLPRALPEMRDAMARRPR